MFNISSIYFFLKKSILNNQSAKNLFIYIFSALLINGISLLTTPIFTRVLSLKDYGILSIYQTWVGVFAVFIGFQVSGSIGTARIHFLPEKFQRFLKSIFVLSIIGFFLISIFVLILKESLADLFELEIRLIPYLLIQAFGVSSATFYIIYTVQTKQPIKNALFAFTIAILSVTLSLFLIFDLDNNKYMGRVIGNTITYLGVIIFVFYKFIYQIKEKIKIKDWLYSIPLALPLIIHLISNLIVGQSDRIFITKILSYEDAAIYSVAYVIGSLGLFIGEATNNVWSPWYFDNTKKGDTLTINKASKFYIFTMSLIFGVLMLSSPEILYLMAPKEYMVGVKSLILVVVSVYFQFLYRFPLAFEQYSVNLRWVAVCTVLTAIINLYLNSLFISNMGIFGAAFATFISYIILFGLHEYIARKIIRGYNIEFNNYVPGIIIVTIVSIFSYLLIDYLYLRLLLLIFLVFLIIKKAMFYLKTNISTLD